MKFRVNAENGDGVAAGLAAGGALMGFAPVIAHTMGKMSTWNAFWIKALPTKMAVLNATNTINCTYAGDELNGVSMVLNSANNSSYDVRLLQCHAKNRLISRWVRRAKRNSTTTRNAANQGQGPDTPPESDP